ncbi:putative periplasmic serine endoprotease DegP-like precursor [Enhygromyxa salina]|uniref:Putative periplasmic serine endoprotease DegP-like n=1 Tax=Enhygromyxa salina TaxID=215803 RepID=A0A2S9Y7G1_9BACT|nr:trypsin-like peptidase domain-containing protein [Enhygromyxa salina]PRQ01050.1 putative periplasmic serine endoprotease DegP-like precursor [Enhygromyxa salina]
MSVRQLSPHGLFFLAFCVLGAPALITSAGCSNEAQASPPTQPDEAAETAKKVPAASPSVSSPPGPSPVVASKQYDPNQSLAPLIESVQPTVVSIQARSSRSGMFGRRSGGGIGSGFVISADGLVVTNHHVVAGNDEFEVHLQDGRRFEATVVGSDPQTDVAVMRLTNARGLKAVTFGSSEGLRVGDWVVAMGSPMGLEQTVTRGIVSAKGRGSLGLYQDGYADFLQTDAAINPGNSGGPLFNLAGEVIGINTAVGGHDGLGFAIPIDQATVVIPKLIKDGKVTRGWLGVGGRDEPPAFGAMPQKGAIIGEVHAGTPAALAGLQAGDQVIEIDGKAIEDFDELRTRIGEYSPKDTVTLELMRAGKREQLKVELGQRPEPGSLARMPSGRTPTPTPTPKSKRSADLYKGKPARLGVEVRETAGGVVIERVVEGGLGHRLGLRQGDVLERINGKTVSSVIEIIAALEADRSHAKVDVRRGSGRHTAVVSEG